MGIWIQDPTLMEIWIQYLDGDLKIRPSWRFEDPASMEIWIQDPALMKIWIQDPALMEIWIQDPQANSQICFSILYVIWGRCDPGKLRRLHYSTYLGIDPQSGGLNTDHFAYIYNSRCVINPFRKEWQTTEYKLSGKSQTANKNWSSLWCCIKYMQLTFKRNENLTTITLKGQVEGGQARVWKITWREMNK